MINLEKNSLMDFDCKGVESPSEKDELASLLDYVKVAANLCSNEISFAERDIYNLIDKISLSYEGEDAFCSTHKEEAASGENIINNQAITKQYEINRVRQDFPILNSDKKLIWLDNAATTQKPLVVINAVKEFYEKCNSNIHRGNYELSERATEMYEDVRKKVAQFINAESASDIIFVRGATEGINLIANTFGVKFLHPGDEILITHLEHHSNILPWQMLCKKNGCTLRIIPIDNNGDVLLEQYAEMLNKNTKLVAITHVSNAIGTVLPIETMTSIAKHYGAHVLIDGAQSAPHLDIDVQKINCDFFIFSGHKLFAPTGIGVVYARREIMEDLPPWQVGGGMIAEVSFTKATYMPTPYKYEAGTGNISSVYGLKAAIDYLNEIGLHNITAYEDKLVTYTVDKLCAIPKVKVIGRPKHRAGSIPFIIDGISDDTVGKYLNEKGIALRIGHHCAQPTMEFFGTKTMIRPSLAFYNTTEDVDIFIDAISAVTKI